MNKKLFVVSILILTLLASFFYAGGVKPALAETTTLADAAGMTAWYQCVETVDVPCPTISDYTSAFSVIEYKTTDYIIGTVDIPIYVDEYNPQVLVHKDGYIVAFYPNTDPAAKMIDVIAKTLNTTLLKYAVVMVGAAGGLNVANVSYYDFRTPEATDMLVLADTKSDGENAFSLTMPLETVEITTTVVITDTDGITTTEVVTTTEDNYTYYDKSYGFYQTYLPEFTLNTVNFIEDNADFIAPGYYGSIFGHFYPDPDPDDTTVITDLEPGVLSDFTVNSGSTSAFGAVVVTYSNVAEPVGDFEITEADLKLELALSAPGTMGDDTTYETLPGAFTKTNPTDDASGLSLNPTLDWSDSTSPNYEYCIDTMDNDACDTTWVSTGAVSQVTLSGLLFDTTYYWQVRAMNSSGSIEADGGAWFSFTTEAIKAPAAFNKVSPLDDALNFSPNGVVLDWNESYGAYSYEYCYSASTSCTNWVNVGTNTSVTLPDLKFKTTYTWQVRAVNTIGTTEADGGTAWSFSTLDTFSKLLPVNGALNQKTRVTLTWEKLGTSTYEYCIDETEGVICDTGWKSAGTATKVSIGLSFGKTYYWQVRAYNGVTTIYANDDNDPATSDWWSFTTAVKNTPGTKVQFVKISPQDGATDVSTTVTLKWINVGASKYEYCYDTVDDDSCTTWVDAGTANSVTIEGLTFPTTYYWQVRATIDNVLTYADKGAFWEFTTEYNKLSPEDHAVGLLATNTKLDWQDVSGATKYEYCLDTDEYCNAWLSTDVKSEVTLSDLAYATTYYWQVRATVGSELIYADGDNSAYWRFKTEELVKTSPVSGAIDQLINITLDWGEVSGEGIAYEYCLYSDVVCTEWVSTATSSTATITGLSYSTTYYWQVRANVGTATVPVWLYADGGSFWNFTTIADPTIIVP